MLGECCRSLRWAHYVWCMCMPLERWPLAVCLLYIYFQPVNIDIAADNVFDSLLFMALFFL